MDLMLSYSMIGSFADKATEYIFHGRNTRAARSACPRALRSVATRKLDQFDSAETIDDLRIPPGNRLEKLSGNRAGEYSIRINEIVHGRRSVTPSTALRLSKYLGTSPGYWMNLQLRCDLYEAQKEEERAIEEITPLESIH